MNQISLNEFKNTLSYLIDNNKRLVDTGKFPIAIGCEGEAGCGKTSVIEQLAIERGMTFVKLNLQELEEVGDLTGFPLKEFKINELDENGNIIDSKWVAHDLISTYFSKPCETYEITSEFRMSYATPAWLPREDNPNGTMLLLDDYTRANSMFLQATMELICRGSYISWSLPKYTNIVLTSNPDSSDYRVETLDSAQASRFINFNIKFDVKDWAIWAEKAGIDGRGINFLLSYHSEIFKSMDGVNRVNARSYTMFINAISGISDWETPENLATILTIAKGCFSFDQDNVIGTLFTQFIINKLDKLVEPEDLLMKDWKTVRPRIKNCVYDNDIYRPDIANILSTRLLNYIMIFFETKGAKTMIVQDRLLDIINCEDNLFTEDLIFNIVKTLASKYKSRMNKILTIPSIMSKLI